jgi:hypothetical protein
MASAAKVTECFCRNESAFEHETPADVRTQPENAP